MIRNACLAVTLAAGACGGEENNSPPPQVQAETPAPAATMPDELKDAILQHSARIGKTRAVDALVDAPYEEYGVRKVGETTIRYATINTVSHETRIPPDLHAKLFEEFLDLTQSDPTLELDIYDESQFTSPNAPSIKAQATMSPRNKDVYVLSVPGTTDIGKIGDSQLPAQAFTQEKTDPLVSFVQLDQSGFDPTGTVVESCQAAIDVQVTNMDTFPKATAEALHPVVQEQTCIALGEAKIAAMSGISHNKFVQIQLGNIVRLVGTVPSAYVGPVPYVNNEAYAELGNNQLTTLDDRLLYPL